jgi:ribonuclease P protein component
MPARLGFGKGERLKSRKQIDALFTEGRSFHAFPVRMAYRFFPQTAQAAPSLLAGVSAPKRSFKKAVDRNRIKRLLREAYRLQKPELLELLATRNLAGHVFFLYTGKELPQFKVIEAAMHKCLQHIHRKANETTF